MTDILAAGLIFSAFLAGLAALFLADIAGEADAPGYWRTAIGALALALTLAGAAGWTLRQPAPAATAALASEVR